MRNYIFRRLALAVVALFGVSLIVFLLMRVLPGDVAMMLLVGQGGEGTVTEAALAAKRAELGTDRPLYEQYLKWIGGFTRLNVGDSLRTGVPVFEEIKNRLPLTFELATMVVIVATLIAIPLGVVSAIRQGSWLDYALRVLSVGGFAMPIFWTGTLIIMGLVFWFRWIPPIGYVSFFEDPLVNLQQLIWPAIAMGYYQSAVITRMTRSCMLEVLRQDYIRTAWAKGLRERMVIYRHALKNAMLPVITLIGAQYAYLLGGTVIMETVFFLPGMGSGLVDSIFFRDYTMVQTIILIFAAIIVAANLVVDILYAALDPRIVLE
ncbi:MAG: ABC transporter permease [Chloroflexi bacterium]|nr:ABC transporter permease [Chloroflexota bacterium]